MAFGHSQILQVCTQHNDFISHHYAVIPEQTTYNETMYLTKKHHII